MELLTWCQERASKIIHTNQPKHSVLLRRQTITNTERFVFDMKNSFLWCGARIRYTAEYRHYDKFLAINFHSILICIHIYWMPIRWRSMCWGFSQDLLFNCFLESLGWTAVSDWGRWIRENSIDCLKIESIFQMKSLW